MTTKSKIAAAVTLLAAGCAHATPVGPAPLSPEAASTLQSAIVGTCEVTATQKPNGERQTASGLKWTFASDGHGSMIAGGMHLGNFNYRLDGKNLLMDGTYKAIRVDDWSTSTMTWFLYDISEIYYCTKQ